MAYKAGTLDVDFRGIDAGATQSITNVVVALRKLRRVDYEKIATGFSNMTTAIDPFITKIKSAEASLTALYGILSKTSGKKIQGLLNYSGGNKNKGGFSGFFSKASWLTSIYFARRLGGYVQSIAQSGADYTETLNLWEVAMGNNLVLAEEFVKKMNTAYGISEKTLMNAQATFKNMLGSLGQISDATAYRLSEGVTQMAIDYASLYNVQFEKAFEKFQAALAGQVRPIRSVSGYDITENTLYQLYQSLGGTKSVRNLSRTEKQLLSILAIFNQMERSGAIGDLNKTINSFANQSRILAESWSEFKTYLGITLTYLIQESGILTKISGTLMFLSDVLKAYAESVGAIQHFGDPFEPVTDGAESALEAVDKLSGKLLDFDKFRALSSNEESGLGLDENLLEALSGYDSILASASNNARELANSLKSQFDEAKNLGNTLSALEGINPLIALIATIGNSGFFEMLKEILPSVKSILDDVMSLVFIIFSNLSDGLSPILKKIKDIVNFTSVIVDLISPIVSLISSVLTLLEPILDIIRLIGYIVSVVITGAFWAVLGVAGLVFSVFEVILKVVQTIAKVISALINWEWGSLGDNLSKIWQNWNIADFFNRWGNFQMPAINDYAEGGLPDKGTVFRAGEAGAEIVYNTPSGQSGVANIQQIAQAQLSALNSWWKTARNDIPVFEGVSESGLYTVVDGEASRRGLGFAKR